MFENTLPSESQLIPDLSASAFLNFAEMNKKETVCIKRTINKTNCSTEPFNIRKIRSQIISDPNTTIFTDIVKISFSLVYLLTQKNMLH